MDPPLARRAEGATDGREVARDVAADAVDGVGRDGRVTGAVRSGRPAWVHPPGTSEVCAPAAR